MSIDIFSLLQTIPNHNPHYLKRYFIFVTTYNKANLEKSKSELGYSEDHHILPVSMFPEYKSFSEYPCNKAVLTYRQHIIAHVMLWKAYPKEAKMVHALRRTLNCGKGSTLKIPTSIHIRLLEKFRIENSSTMSLLHKGKIVSAETRAKMSESRKGENNHMYGKTHSAESLAKMSTAMRGKYKGKNNPNYGKTLSEEHRAKISDAGIGRIVSEETRAKLSVVKIILTGERAHQMKLE